MPDLYDVLATYTVVEFTPPNRQAKKTEVVAVSKPSNIEFYVRLEPTSHLAAAVAAGCNQVATALNTDAQIPGVSGIVINQEIDANNKVDYTLDVTVVSDDGDLFQTITLPWNDVWPPAMERPVAATVATLNAIKEGT